MSGKCDLLAFPIAGHHGGLPSPTQLKQRLSDPKELKNSAIALERAKTVLPGLFKDLDLEQFVPSYLQTSGLKQELFIRMLFSCLTDADFLDTEAHFSPDKVRLEPTSYR